MTSGGREGGVAEDQQKAGFVSASELLLERWHHCRSGNRVGVHRWARRRGRYPGVRLRTHQEHDAAADRRIHGPAPKLHRRRHRPGKGIASLIESSRRIWTRCRGAPRPIRGRRTASRNPVRMEVVALPKRRGRRGMRTMRSWWWLPAEICSPDGWSRPCGVTDPEFRAPSSCFRQTRAHRRFDASWWHGTPRGSRPCRGGCSAWCLSKRTGGAFDCPMTAPRDGIKTTTRGDVARHLAYHGGASEVHRIAPGRPRGSRLLLSRARFRCRSLVMVRMATPIVSEWMFAVSHERFSEADCGLDVLDEPAVVPIS